MFNFIKKIFKSKNTVNIPPLYFLPDEIPSNIERIIGGEKEFIYKGYRYKFCYQAIPDEGFDAFFGQGDGRNAYIRKEKIEES